MNKELISAGYNVPMLQIQNLNQITGIYIKEQYCIGCGLCEKLLPQYFEMADKKAKWKDSIKINRAYILYVALTMIGLSFISFMCFDRSITSYLIINTLMMGAFGICDLFWWSILGSLLDYTDNPTRILGIGLSMNVLGILIGGFIGNSIVSVERDGFNASVIALVIIFIVLIMLPLLNTHLSRLLKNHAFLIEFASLADSEKEKVMLGVWDNVLLTEKEKEVIKLLIRGYTYKAISENLFISDNTTKFHIKNIYQKLNVNNKMELIKIFSENKNSNF